MARIESVWVDMNSYWWEKWANYSARNLWINGEKSDRFKRYLATGASLSIRKSSWKSPTTVSLIHDWQHERVLNASVLKRLARHLSMHSLVWKVWCFKGSGEASFPPINMEATTSKWILFSIFQAIIMVNGLQYTCPDGDSAPLIKIRTHLSNSRLRVVSDSRRTRQTRKTRDSRGRHATDGEDTRQELLRDKRLPTYHSNRNQLDSHEGTINTPMLSC